MTIRPLEIRDIPVVHALLRELSEHLGEQFEITIEEIELHARCMIERPDMYASFVADDHGVKGFLSMVFYRTYLHKTGTALINELVVDSRFRGSGTGAALVRHAVAESGERGMDEIEVGMLKENCGAIRFYRRNGFNEEYVLLGRHLAQQTGADR